MARKCEDSILVEMLCTDHRLLVVGPGMAMLWLNLVRLIRRLGSDGVLTLGDAIGYPLGSMREVAFALHIRGTEAETQFETQVTQLVQRGLLQSPNAATLALPLDLMPSARAIAARLNGRKGGRPPKSRVPEGQASMLLPITGGAEGKPMETQDETQGVARHDVARTSLSLASKPKEKLSLTTDEQNRIGRAAFEAAGFDTARNVGNWGIVSQWLADGADEALILETIGAVIERGAKPQHLGYFSKAIADAIAKRPASEGDAFKAWDAADRAWWAGGKRGPQPKFADFQERRAS